MKVIKTNGEYIRIDAYQDAISELEQSRAKCMGIDGEHVTNIDTVMAAIIDGPRIDMIVSCDSEVWDIVAEYDLRKVCAYLLSCNVGFERWGFERSPLMVAAHVGNLEIVRMMLDHGWNPDEWTDVDNETPLSIAAASGKDDVFFLLLERGASLHFVGYDHEMTCDPAGERFEIDPGALLYEAVRGRSVKICRFLVEHVDMNTWPGRMMCGLCGEGSREFCINCGIPILAQRFVPAWDAYDKWLRENGFGRYRA